MYRKCSIFVFILAAAFILGTSADAQTAVNDSLHPFTYSYLQRTPWQGDQLDVKLTHTAAAGRADTLTLTGLATTATVQFTRATPAMIANEPTLTVSAGTLIITFAQADTLTYYLRIKKYSIE